MKFTDDAIKLQNLVFFLFNTLAYSYTNHIHKLTPHIYIYAVEINTCKELLNLGNLV